MLVPTASSSPFGLTTLDLCNTLLSDLSPLAGLSRLTRLDLDGTPVSDLSPLVGLSGLDTLWLHGTSVSDEKVATFYEERRRNGLEKMHIAR